MAEKVLNLHFPAQSSGMPDQEWAAFTTDN